MSRLFATRNRQHIANHLATCLLGSRRRCLDLFCLAAVVLGPAAHAQGQYPNQYPQNRGQSNSYYAPTQAVQPVPGQMISSQPSAPIALEPVFVKRHNFDIPLNVNARGTTPPAEVHLFVSRDSGRSWEFYSRESPSAARFAFSAPADGEYWFAVRPSSGAPTSGPQGTPLVAAGSLAPSLRVAVDTTQPTVDLDSAADASGVVNLQFSIRDNAPTTSGVQIYYRTDTPGAEWLSLDSNRIQWLRGGDGKLDGQIGFDPQVDWRRVSLHFVAMDQAGNQTTAQKIIERPRVAGTPALLASAPAAGNPAPPVSQPGYTVVSPQPAYPPGYGVQPTQGQITSGQITSGQGNTAQGYQVTEQRMLGYRGFNAQAQPSTPPPPAYQSREDADALASLTASANAAGNSSMSNFSSSSAGNSTLKPADINGIRPPSSAFRAIETESLPAPPQRSSISTTPGEAVSNPQPDRQQQALGQTAGSASPATAAPPAEQELPVDVSEINFSRQAEFSLDYEFDSLGSRGVKKVELWGTRDAGRTWDYWGADPDNAPPFDVSVSGQGLYGFRIVVVDSQNLTSPTPQPGDEPEIYILVDKTAPMVKLVSASYGEGAEAGSLVIEYTYKDENPIARPISLSFSDSQSGPWTTIATGLENTGRYLWQIDPRLPKNLFLRVEGSDRAGNTGVEVNSNPVSLRGISPTARIKSFQPLSPDR